MVQLRRAKDGVLSGFGNLEFDDALRRNLCARAGGGLTVSDLVEVVGQSDPKLVKMAPHGERLDG